MKKTSFNIASIAVISFSLFVGSYSFAQSANTPTCYMGHCDFYQVDSYSTSPDIDEWGQCYSVWNGNLGEGLFVPTNSQEEWASLIDHAYQAPNVNLYECAPTCDPNYGGFCQSVANSCGMRYEGTTECDGSCSIGDIYTAPPESACPSSCPTAGQSCSSSANACGQTNTGTIDANSCTCSASTPSNPSGYGNSCSNSCGMTGTIGCSGTCSVDDSMCGPSCVPSTGQSCSSSANACGQTSSGSIQCDGSCSASTPSLPAGYGNACTSSANACGSTNSGTIQCNGTCSATTPANPVGYGSACTSSANVCGLTNSGTIQCNGTCSATTPANPAGYGTSCTSTPNSCGMTNTGTYICDGTTGTKCSASPVPESSCPICTTPGYDNYNQPGTCACSGSRVMVNGSCTDPVYGCTEPTALNYDPNANYSDGSCKSHGCMDLYVEEYYIPSNTAIQNCETGLSGDRYSSYTETCTTKSGCDDKYNYYVNHIGTCDGYPTAYYVGKILTVSPYYICE